MIWSVFNYLLTQKLPRKANVALGCPQYKKLLKTLKVAQKLPNTIYLCLLFVGDIIANLATKLPANLATADGVVYSSDTR